MAGRTVKRREIEENLEKTTGILQTDTSEIQSQKILKSEENILKDMKTILSETEKYEDEFYSKRVNTFGHAKSIKKKKRKYRRSIKK